MKENRKRRKEEERKEEEYVPLRCLAVYAGLNPVQNTPIQRVRSDILR